MILAWKHVFYVMIWRKESVNKELQKLKWSCQSKKENERISSTWIKTTNNDFYTLIRILFHRENQEKYAHNRKHSYSSNHFARPWFWSIVIFRWSSPIPVYSKIFLQTKVHYTIKKGRDIFCHNWFTIENWNMAHFWWDDGAV